MPCNRCVYARKRENIFPAIYVSKNQCYCVLIKQWIFFSLSIQIIINFQIFGHEFISKRRIRKYAKFCLVICVTYQLPALTYRLFLLHVDKGTIQKIDTDQKLRKQVFFLLFSKNFSFQIVKTLSGRGSKKNGSDIKEDQNECY